ncbi:hypothetical protein GGI15_004475 [Coemansia interrupta]|uniref:Uncharacterized protein n=1 Tax=Coemansia interrupta TaxID=1126814 RepID=A0A9W8H476_9FUNG|nr:hypothetical protein GGI15_004475 [Coemansia interrupta]
MSRHQLVHVVFRYPFGRPATFIPPSVTSAHTRLADQVWQRLVETETSPSDILAELEHDQVTFDWEQLASVLHVPLDAVFEAASELFRRHMGRPLRLVEQEQEQEQEDEEEGVGMRSVESVGRRSEVVSPAVGMSIRTPEEEEEEEEGEGGVAAELRMSLAQAMGERHVEKDDAGAEKAAADASSSSSFSDLSDTSLTSSAMQDALLAEAMNGSTMMGSILGSRMFPWGKR